MHVRATAAIAGLGTARLRLTAIARDVTTLDRERMAHQADTFAAALQRDLIDAGDFRP